MDAEKRQRYEKIAAEIVRLAGGRDNILGVAHCATRLRLVLENNDRADIPGIENVDLVKGVFVAGDQLQIIFGAGLYGRWSDRKRAGERDHGSAGVDDRKPGSGRILCFLGSTAADRDHGTASCVWRHRVPASC